MVIEVLTREIPERAVVEYPIGGEAVRAVLRSIPTERTPFALVKYISNDSTMLSAENYYANGYLMIDREKILPRYMNLEFQLGVALAYKFFKHKAGGQLPSLSSEFIKYYDEEREKHMARAHGEDPDDRGFGSIEEEKIRRGLFVVLEKDAYEVLRERLQKPGELFFEQPVFAGIVAAYFLFKQGFRDNRYWEPKPN